MRVAVAVALVVVVVVVAVGLVVVVVVKMVAVESGLMASPRRRDRRRIIYLNILILIFSLIYILSYTYIDPIMQTEQPL